LQKLFNLKI